MHILQGKIIEALVDVNFEVAQGEIIGKKGIMTEVANEKAMQILKALGLPEALWSGFPVTFSGGEQQRINVARAIIDPPRLLLIDEPTASLDPTTKDVVIEMLLGLKKLGSTLVCISHDEYTLDHLVNRRIHLEKGIIIN